MPRISAPTVAEHRAKQERLLLDIAHSILQETGTISSMGKVAERAGLARSSIYQYFDSREALFDALVQDIFPQWTERVTAAMFAQTELSDQILAYAIANVELVHEGAHAVGSALATLTPGEELNEQAARMHQQIQEPLLHALTELQVTDPQGVSELVNSVVHASTRLLESGQSLERVCNNLTIVLSPMAKELRLHAERAAAHAH